MAELQPIPNHFKKFQRPVFKDVPTSLHVAVIEMAPNTELQLETIFRNIHVITIQGYERPKKKKITLPHPGIPWTIISAKYGTEVRGIVKVLKPVEKEKKGKRGRFPNQVTLDVSLTNGLANVMVFKHKMKITGCKTIEDTASAFQIVTSYIRLLNNQGLYVWNEPIVFKKYVCSMTNLTFRLGFAIDKEDFHNAVIEAARDDKFKGFGCYFNPNNDDAINVTFPMGENKAKGGPRFFSFRMQHTGSVRYSGKERSGLMKEIFEKFLDLVEEIEPLIRKD